ncbi:MAG: HEAT repeat domain-containing protein [Planctomycetes bacterium]|nr:HEAT repeat domain-containing protein [Planctomycetota bacterium]
MKTLTLLAALLGAACLLPLDLARSHGGTYRGPGDTVPPGGGGGGGGGGPSTGPGPAQPGGPSQPGPSRPGTGGSGPVPAPGPNPSQPVTPGSGDGGDPTAWQYWWGFNKDPFLDLKTRLYGPGVVTGSDVFFLGHGQKPQAKDVFVPSRELVRGRIVPALLRVLEDDASGNDLQTGALLALAKIGDEPGEDGSSGFHAVFLRFLKDPTQDVAETAAVALGVLGNPASIDDLEHLALDTPSERMRLVGAESGVAQRTRAFATFGLGQIGGACDDLAVRRRIVEVLWRLGESTRSADRDLQVAAVLALGLVPLDREPIDAAVQRDEAAPLTGPPRWRDEQVRYLLAVLADGKRDVYARAHAPRSLATLLEGVDDAALQDEVVSALLPLLDERARSVPKELRQSVALALGQLGDLDLDARDVALRAALQGAVTNADQQVRRFCLMALGDVGGRPGSGADACAAEVEVQRFLLQQLARGKSGVKPWAGLALGVMQRGLQDRRCDPSADVLAALRAALADAREKDEVGAYAVACGVARDGEASELLLEKLHDLSDDEARGFLALGLGLVPSPEAKETIEALVRDSRHRPELLKQAAIALGLLGDKQVALVLAEELAQARTLSTQAALAAALGTIGDARSADPLLELLEDETKSGAARGFAAVALGIVADRASLPWNTRYSLRINYRARTETLLGGGSGLLDLF